MQKKTINHKLFLGLGLVFIIIGVIFMFAVNTILGVAFFAIGLGNLIVGFSVKRGG